MSFQIDQRVAFPAFGLGRITARVTKSFFDSDTQDYYEVAGEHSTVWVQVNEATARGLRRLTPQVDLPRYRDVLRSQPGSLNSDARLRHRDISARLKRGSFQDLCEAVRDLNAFGWQAALSEYDMLGLNKGRRWLCQEWAAADGLSLAEATAAVDALLLESRHAFKVG